MLCSRSVAYSIRYSSADFWPEAKLSVLIFILLTIHLYVVYIDGYNTVCKGGDVKHGAEWLNSNKKLKTVTDRRIQLWSSARRLGLGVNACWWCGFFVEVGTKEAHVFADCTH